MALNREAALMDYVGVDNLTNERGGSKYGIFKNYGNNFHKNYGMMVLYVLFYNYINNGAQPFTFDNLCEDIGTKENDNESKYESNCKHIKLNCCKCNCIVRCCKG